MRVSLINTVHGERGAVTLPALLRVLERLAPDVVFAEIPNSHAARYEGGVHGNLESRAVAALGQSRPISVVPVDRDEPSEEFFRVTRELFELVERRSRDYRHLHDHHVAESARLGLRYLNSADSAQALAAIRNEVRDTIDWIRAPELHDVYNMWLQEIELRDREMVANIYQFAEASALASGVFLVGAAHRDSIIQKIEAERSAGRLEIDWRVSLPSELFD